MLFERVRWLVRGWRNALRECLGRCLASRAHSALCAVAALLVFSIASQSPAMHNRVSSSPSRTSRFSTPVMSFLLSPNSTRYSHDLLDQSTGSGFADGSGVAVTRDYYGNVASSRDANGTVISYTYDELNRPTHLSIAPGNGVSSDETFVELEWDGLSRLRSATNDHGTVVFDYDDLSHVKSESFDGLTVNYTPDVSGNVTSCAYPGGRSLAMVYDSLNRLTSISGDGQVIASYTYAGGDGRVASRVLGNGTRTDYEYDGQGSQGVKQVTRTTHTGASGVIDERAYSWDANQSKTSRVDVRAGGSGRVQNFTNDYLGTLTHSTSGSLSVGYTVDPAGNLRQVDGATSAAGAYALRGSGARLNQLAATPFDTRTYDGAGNLKTCSATTGFGSDRSFTYNWRNQPVEVRTRRGIVRYSYDALGRCISRTVLPRNDEPSTTRYVYSGWHVIEERNEAGQVTASYVYGARTDEVLTAERNCEHVYYHADDLGNVVALSDAQGRVIERYDYDDYGRPLFMNAGGQPREGSSNALLFNGHRYDAEIGLYDYRTRYYDPYGGRFISRDSIGDWGDTGNLGNGYAYVGGSPWSGVDPYGLEAADYARSVRYWVNANAWKNPVGDVLYGATEFVTAPLLLGEGTAEITVNHDRMSVWQIGLTSVGEVGNAAAIAGGVGGALKGAGAVAKGAQSFSRAAKATKTIVRVEKASVQVEKSAISAEESIVARVDEVAPNSAGTIPTEFESSEAYMAEWGHLAAAERAQALQSALPIAQQGRVTMGAAAYWENGAVRIGIASSEPGFYLREAVRSAKFAWERVAGGIGHAEAKLINAFRPFAVAAGRRVCPSCATTITEADAAILTRLRRP